MIRGRVSGKLWASRRIDTMPSGALLEVRTEAGATLVAFDPLGCAPGEAVLVTQGSVAAAWFERHGGAAPPAPVDALIVGSIDEVSQTTPPVGVPGQEDG